MASDDSLAGEEMSAVDVPVREGSRLWRLTIRDRSGNEVHRHYFDLPMPVDGVDNHWESSTGRSFIIELSVI